MDKKTKKEPGVKEWAVILGAGVLLLFLSVPDFFREKEKTVASSGAKMQRKESQSEGYAQQMEKKLKEMLLKMNGVSGAEVIITLKSTTEKVVLRDKTVSTEQLQEEDGTGGSRTSQKSTQEDKTVVAGTEPYLTKELTPAVEGVVIFAKGLESEGVLAVTEAVQALFDLPAHKVKIIRN